MYCECVQCTALEEFQVPSEQWLVMVLWLGNNGGGSLSTVSLRQEEEVAIGFQCGSAIKTTSKYTPNSNC